MDGLKAFLMEQGADLVGFADMRGVANAKLPYGVSIAMRLPPELVRSIEDGPNMAYFEAYHSINARLNAAVQAGQEYLEARGFAAWAQTTGNVVRHENHRTDLPHKTVATRAGLGWIGKCALLVTREYGSAIRISSLLTDAPLDCAAPVEVSSCGDCRACVEHCPGGAVRGSNWEASAARESIFDPDKCRKAARALSQERIGKEITLCGRCFVVCPYTKRALQQVE